MSRTAGPRQGGETGLFSSPAPACNSRGNSGVFRRSSRDGRLLSPTAGAVFMLLRSAMAAAAGHAIFPLMLGAGVRGIPAAANAYISAPVRDGGRRLVPAKSLLVSHSPDGQLAAVSASLAGYAGGTRRPPQGTPVFTRPGPPVSIRRPGYARRGAAPSPG